MPLERRAQGRLELDIARSSSRVEIRDSRISTVGAVLMSQSGQIPAK